mmetsp:Transcript_15285/g.48986  ORF Transcript_15285/g.48986 Transcript_15285/m.48986 type:complete len:456 (+) Transcript_15285:2-1369(+)
MVGFVLLLNHWQDHAHLHDVVNGSQGQQRNQALLADLDFRGRLVESGADLLLLEQPGINEQLVEEVPLGIILETYPLFRLRHAQVVRAGQSDRGPSFVHAVGKPFFAIDVYPHHPIDCVEGSDGSLVLVSDGSARVARVRLAVCSPPTDAGRIIQQIQAQLREARQVRVELGQGIHGFQDLAGDFLRQSPICLHALHARPEDSAGRFLRSTFVLQTPLHGAEIIGGRRHPAHDPPFVDLDRDRRGRGRAPNRAGRAGRGSFPGRQRHGASLLHLRRGLAGTLPGPDVELRADGQALLVLLPVEVEVPLSGSELLALRQADDIESCMLRVSDAKSHFVDAVHGVQARVPITLDIVLDGISVHFGILHEVQGLPRHRQAQSLLQGFPAPSLPMLRVDAILYGERWSTISKIIQVHVDPREFSQRHLLPLHGLSVVHELHSRKKSVVHPENLSDEPDL